jgi:polyvinyl alcohol dehydrogenase (cytochrome)
MRIPRAFSFVYKRLFAVTALGAALLSSAAVNAQTYDQSDDHADSNRGSNSAGGRHAWPSWGGNLQNSHGASDETSISTSSVADLRLKWQFTTAGDVSATPTVEDDAVYLPDGGGFVYRVNNKTGEAVWSHKVSEYTGIDASYSRTSLAIGPDTVIFGDQGSANIIAVDKRDGSLLWHRNVDTTVGAYVTSSPVIDGDRIYVGVASGQESLASKDPKFVPNFRGSVVALDLRTGQLLWQTYTVPVGYTGGSVWGGNLAIDHARGLMYASTGNNYSIPEAADRCVSGATTAQAKLACLDRADTIDAVMAVDLRNGQIRWTRRLYGVDTWTVSCVAQPNLGIPCPDNAGPDYDFGSAPNFFTVHAGGRTRDVVGAGQKSGMYWALDPDTGDVLWGTQVGPGGTLGGIEWGSAVDGQRVYVALNNSTHAGYKLGGSGNSQVWNAGSWAALDALTGRIEWQVPASGQNPLNTALAAGATGQMSIANGVVFAGSLSGDMVALDASNGRTLWKFASGGSVVDGPSIVDGTVYWGSGYAHLKIGTTNNKLYAFTLPQHDDGNDNHGGNSGNSGKN